MINDRYEVIDQIGAGGMATVWKARDTLLDRFVAIKRPLPHLTSGDTHTERFLREARGLARLANPGIVAIYDAGVDEDGPFIVLELVDGATLAQHVSTAGVMNPATVIGVVGDVAEALDHAHAQGIVHRDIKPSNIMIAEDGTARLTDFGIAAMIDDTATLTSVGELIGTIGYMAPELLEGGEATPASDIYSLGAVTYEMLAGHPPFSNDSIGALVADIGKGVPPPPVTVPTELAHQVLEAMARDPLDRPRSAVAFAAGLTSSTTLLLDRPPLTAATPAGPNDTTRVIRVGDAPPSRRLVKWGWVAAAVVAALFLVLGAAALFNRSPASESANLPPTSTTSTSTTSTSVTTTTSLPTTTTLPDTTETRAALVQTAIEDLRPPDFKAKDVKRLKDKVEDLMAEWAKGGAKLDERFKTVFKELAKLPESPERNSVEEMLIALAKTMGVGTDGVDTAG